MQQQTGMLLRQRQQVQPHFIIIIMQAQHSWIILQHWASPLVQVMQTPSFIISHLHMPMVMLKPAIIMPLFIMQQLIMFPAIMLHRFCSMLAAMASSLVHIIFIPPSHFSIFMTQRGIIIMFIAGMGVDPDIDIGVIIGLLIIRSMVIIAFIEFVNCFEGIAPVAGWRLPSIFFNGSALGGVAAGECSRHCGTRLKTPPLCLPPGVLVNKIFLLTADYQWVAWFLIPAMTRGDFPAAKLP